MPRPDCERESKVKGKGEESSEQQATENQRERVATERVHGDANGMFFFVVACIFECVNIVIGQNEVCSSVPLSLFSSSWGQLRLQHRLRKQNPTP